MKMLNLLILALSYFLINFGGITASPVSKNSNVTHKKFNDIKIFDNQLWFKVPVALSYFCGEKHKCANDYQLCKYGVSAYQEEFSVFKPWNEQSPWQETEKAFWKVYDNNQIDVYVVTVKTVKPGGGLAEPITIEKNDAMLPKVGCEEILSWCMENAVCFN